MFLIEDIPNDAIVYRRISHDQFFNGRVTTAAFIPRKIDKGELSVNWNKYSTPESTVNEEFERNRQSKYNGCISLKVNAVREIDLEVEHRPRENKQEH